MFNSYWLNIEFEFIICSAIWYKELELKKPEVLQIRGFKPINVHEGIVFCGQRHPHCMYQMIAVTGKRSVSTEVGKYEQGFITNKNRFVNREEAAKIAFNSGQIKDKIKRLHSEDIF